MCRLFGFRSVIRSQVHHSLVSADNALAIQSKKHPDGWGVAYYVANAPHVIKGGTPAIDDKIFRRVSGVVASETVLAHIRKATVGEINILNSHPFQYGKWVLAHNGEVFRFGEARDRLFEEVAPNLRRFILGDTDSELLFYLFLTRLALRVDLHRRGTPIEEVAAALAEMVQRTREIADGSGDDERSKLTFIVTDGQLMLASRSNMPLKYSTYKTRCSARDTCPHLARECEAPTLSGYVNHFIATSEELQGDNTWSVLDEDSVVGVDWRMMLYSGRLGGAMTPQVQPR